MHNTQHSTNFVHNQRTYTVNSVSPIRNRSVSPPARHVSPHAVRLGSKPFVKLEDRPESYVTLMGNREYNQKITPFMGQIVAYKNDLRLKDSDKPVHGDGIVNKFFGAFSGKSDVEKADEKTEKSLRTRAENEIADLKSVFGQIKSDRDIIAAAEAQIKAAQARLLVRKQYTNMLPNGELWVMTDKDWENLIERRIKSLKDPNSLPQEIFMWELENRNPNKIRITPEAAKAEANEELEAKGFEDTFSTNPRQPAVTSRGASSIPRRTGSPTKLQESQLADKAVKTAKAIEVLTALNAKTNLERNRQIRESTANKIIGSVHEQLKMFDSATFSPVQAYITDVQFKRKPLDLKILNQKINACNKMSKSHRMAPVNERLLV